MSFLPYRSGSVGALAGNRQGHRVPSMFDSLVPLPAIRDRKSYAAIAREAASSIRHFAMTFATDLEVQLNG